MYINILNNKVGVQLLIVIIIHLVLKKKQQTHAKNGGKC